MHWYDITYLEKARNSMAVMLDFAVHNLHRDADAFFELFITTGNASLFERGDIRTLAGTSGVELACRVLSDSGISFEIPAYRYTSGRSREFWAGWSLADYQWERAVSFEEITIHVSISRIISICDNYREATIKRLSQGLSWMDTVKIPDHMSEEDQQKFSLDLDRLIFESLVGTGMPEESDSITANDLKAGSDLQSGRYLKPENDLQSGNKSNEGRAQPETRPVPPETRLRRLRLINRMSQSRLAAASAVPVRTIQQYEQRRKDINKARFSQILKLAAVLNCEPSRLAEPEFIDF